MTGHGAHHCFVGTRRRVSAPGGSVESQPQLGASDPMSTYTSEPGTRLGGRYRLEDRIAAASGWAAWKAIDEILARAVTVFTFAPGFPRIREVVTAARAASRLTDARLAQVFDVEDDWDHAYIVMEWATGARRTRLPGAAARGRGR